MDSVDKTLVGVIGLGIMGAGIVEVFSAHGYHVIGVAESDEAVAQGKKNLTKSLTRAVERQKITEAASADLQNRITWNSSLSALSECDLVVEAAPEILQLKFDIFSQLDSIVKPSCILATNTSSLSVTQIAKSTNQPENVLGFHFFNPAPLMQLVEIIPAVQTSETTLKTTIQTITNWKKIVAVYNDAWV